MSNEKKSVKRRTRVLEARDLLSVTGGQASGHTGDHVGFVPLGPSWPSPKPWGPTIGFNPTGPRNPSEK